jgi:hypothetical protein
MRLQNQHHLTLFEYMALRNPIVSTDIRERHKYSSVPIRKDYDDLITKIYLTLQSKG